MNYQPLNYNFSNKLTSTQLLKEIEMHFASAVSVLYLTATKTFQKDGEQNRKLFFSILLGLGTDIKELFEGLFHKHLPLTSVYERERIYHVNTQSPAIKLYDKLYDKTAQLISLITLGSDQLFLDDESEDKLNFLFSVQDALIQSKSLLELSFARFPELYSSQVSSQQKAAPITED